MERKHNDDLSLSLFPTLCFIFGEKRGRATPNRRLGSIELRLPAVTGIIPGIGKKETARVFINRSNWDTRG